MILNSELAREVLESLGGTAFERDRNPLYPAHTVVAANIEVRRLGRLWPLMLSSFPDPIMEGPYDLSGHDVVLRIEPDHANPDSGMLFVVIYAKGEAKERDYLVIGYIECDERWAQTIRAASPARAEAAAESIHEGTGVDFYVAAVIAGENMEVVA